MPSSDTPPRRYRHGRELRVRRRRDVLATLRTGRRAGDDRMAVWVRSNGLKQTRLGLTVSRKHGPAVHRNRLKRIIREAFRLVRHELPSGLDVICRPRIGAELDLLGTQASLIRLLQRVEKRIAKDASTPPPADGGKP